MSGPSATELDLARDAARRGAWSEAYEQFASIDPSGLGAEDIEAMANAAWWTLRIQESMATRQKAYAAHLAAGNLPRAAYVAWFLSIDYQIMGEATLGSGWSKRAERHLAEVPECAEHGFFAITEADRAKDGGDLDAARALAERAIELGRRFDSRDLEVMGIQTLGRVLISFGDVAEGVRLLDEAMTAVLAEELTAQYIGWVYCNVLSTCMEIVDLRRASEWTRAALAWMASYPESTPYHGLCRLYRVEVTILQGAWSEAATQAQRASEELMPTGRPMAAEALYACGEVHRLRGDLTAAEEAFMHALELGRDPQPGLALLRLAQGKADAAATALRLALTAEGVPLLKRVRLLGAQVEATIASSDLATARAAANEMDAIASASESPALRAMADRARGALHLSEGEVEPAVQRLQRASAVWQELDLPYEAARTRVLMGLACRRAGDEERARLELEAARAAFERLGARVDADAAADLLRTEAELPRGLSAREAEVLRLVAAGKTNREIAAEMVISEHTVSRHLQNIFRKLDVSTRAAATAFAFENSLV